MLADALIAQFEEVLADSRKPDADVVELIARIDALAPLINFMEDARPSAEELARIRRHKEQLARRARMLQARINAAEVKRIRQAACPRCFATHAGEC